MISKKQFFLSLFTSSLFGGLTAIFVYKYFLDAGEYRSLEQKQSVYFSKYSNDTASTLPTGLNFMHAAELVRPGVVHIKSYYDQSSEEVVADENLRDFHEFHREGPLQNQDARESTGSGVIISVDGYIATNHHVIENATSIKVVLEDKRSFEATLIGTDPTTDLALLKIDVNGLAFVRYGNFDKVKIGEWVLAIGNPFDLTSTVTAGIVSAKGRSINILHDKDNMQIESFIQTDAAVNPGNSGGALVNLRGELVGINTAIATTTGSYAGYSFAVPVSLVKKIMEDLLRYGEVQRGLLGVQIDEVTAELASDKNLKLIKGVYVLGVNKGDAADRAGIHPGDVITKVNGTIVNTVADLQALIAIFRPGDHVKITFERRSQEMNVSAVLRNKEGGVTLVQRQVDGLTILGAELKAVGEEEQMILGIKGGVKVVKVEPGKIKSAGIKTDFVITKLTLSGTAEPQAISTPDDIIRIISKGKGALWVEGVYPDGNKGYYAINL